MRDSERQAGRKIKRSQAVEIISKCDTKKKQNESFVCACEGIVASLTQRRKSIKGASPHSSRGLSILT